MSNINANERRNKIVELITKSGFCKSSELSKLFHVSEMTIRRDIQKLEKQGFIEAIHGGARFVSHKPGDYTFQQRMREHKEAKQIVSQRALEFLEPGAIVALDAGTTVLEFARMIPVELQLTVVTYSLPIMTVLANRENIELITMGGTLRANTMAFVGPLALTSLNELRVNTYFLATKAIYGGATYSGNPYDAEIKRALIKASDRVILLVDSSKLGASAGIRVANLEDIDVIISEKKVIENEFIVPQNLQLIYVNHQNDESRHSSNELTEIE